jgi:hypothetical protein
MNTQANEKQPEFQFLGDKFRINFDEVIETKTDEEGNETTTYNYTTACVSKSADYGAIVEAIVAINYPTYGAELSALRKGGEAALAHTEWVDKAKLVALDAVAFRGF